MNLVSFLQSLGPTNPPISFIFQEAGIGAVDIETMNGDRKSTRLNSSPVSEPRMLSSV